MRSSASPSHRSLRCPPPRRRPFRRARTRCCPRRSCCRKPPESPPPAQAPTPPHYVERGESHTRAAVRLVGSRGPVFATVPTPLHVVGRGRRLRRGWGLFRPWNHLCQTPPTRSRAPTPRRASIPCKPPPRTPKTCAFGSTTPTTATTCWTSRRLPTPSMTNSCANSRTWRRPTPNSSPPTRPPSASGRVPTVRFQAAHAPPAHAVAGQRLQRRRTAGFR